MKIAIMQPYFIPYIGYFQLMNTVDRFVVYDNIQYTKKGWINRNRLLVNGQAEYISLPLKKDSDFLHVNQRYLADAFKDEKQKFLRKIEAGYRKAPYFTDVYNLFQRIVELEEYNLFDFLLNSLKEIASYLGIHTEIIISSNLNIDHNLKGSDKVIEICKTLKAEKYINPIGGKELYSKGDFLNKGIELFFIKTNEFEYSQFKNDFLPFLSIVDVMMFNSKDKISAYLDEFILE